MVPVVRRGVSIIIENFGHLMIRGQQEGDCPSVKTHCCFSSSGALCLTRTRVLKADPQEDVGEDCQKVSNKDDDKDLIDINGEDKAERCRAAQCRQGQRYPCTSESITSGQSGDCPVYSQGFIYIWVAHGPWSVRTVNKTLFTINKPCYQ